LRVGRGCKKGFVGKNANDEDGVAGADFVAVGEEGFVDPRAVQESAIAALQVEDAAALFAVIDGEVEAGHELVVRESMIGFGVAAEAERHAVGYRDFVSRGGTGADFKKDSHWEWAQRSRLLAMGYNISSQVFRV
jgi:hypothetical protein